MIELLPQFNATPVTFILLVIDAYIIIRVFRMLGRLIYPRLRIKKIVPHTERSGATKKVLILGDSTGVGTGASREEDTVAGRLYADFPHMSIRNVSVNGYRVRDLFKVLEKEKDTTYDLIILSVGGNDTWHLSDIPELTEDIGKVLDILKKMSRGHVMFLIYTNIGTAPIFPRFIQVFMKERALEIRHRFLDIAEAKGIIVADLFPEYHLNVFTLNPHKYFAPDGFHPSSEGYAVWYKIIKPHVLLDPAGRQ
jgi:lysophospholipase L1-like esterase